jgi:hypothetical protein
MSNSIFVIILLLLFSNCILNVKDFLANKENSSNRISSDSIAIENAEENKFNLLQTISSYEDLEYFDCELIDRLNYFSKKPLTTKKFLFSNRTYFFLNFSNLERDHEYHLVCNKWEWLIDKDLKFPKEKNETNLLSFGDWSEGELGSLSKNFMKSFINKIDSILYLGDLAYNLEVDSGERGNSFLTFIKDISSLAPFQVKISLNLISCLWGTMKRRIIIRITRIAFIFQTEVKIKLSIIHLI